MFRQEHSPCNSRHWMKSRTNRKAWKRRLFSRKQVQRSSSESVSSEQQWEQWERRGSRTLLRRTRRCAFGSYTREGQCAGDTRCCNCCIDACLLTDCSRGRDVLLQC